MKRESDPDGFNSSELRREKPYSGFIIRYELIGIIFALIIQTLTAVWWGATVTTKMDYLQQSMISLKQELKESLLDRYTSKDAAKDIAFVNGRIDRNEVRINRLEGKN